ncbi:MAG: GTP-binding protein [Puniceicoccaceae bacterium]
MIQLSPIPVHLVQGGPGSGKTSTILELLKSAPSNETWAVLLNTNNQPFLADRLSHGAANSPGKVLFRISNGGCFCCSGAPDLASGLRTLVETLRPDRILVEPAGLSDPVNMLEQVKSRELDGEVQLASTIGILDVRKAGHQRFREMPYLRRLLDSSDIILGTKAKLADTATVSRFQGRMESWLSGAKPFSLDSRNLVEGTWQTFSPGLVPA